VAPLPFLFFFPLLPWPRPPNEGKNGSWFGGRTPLFLFGVFCRGKIKGRLCPRFISPLIFFFHPEGEWAPPFLPLWTDFLPLSSIFLRKGQRERKLFLLVLPLLFFPPLCPESAEL